MNQQTDPASKQPAHKLVVPSMRYAGQIMAYKLETAATDGGHFNGVSGLDAFDRVEDWLEYLRLKADPLTRPEGLVDDSSWLCIRLQDDRLVGMINIRHELNDFLLNYGGHIGYSVRPLDRRQGVGVAQLQLALIECRRLGITRVLLTCNDDNEASRRVIQAAGGVLEDVRVRPDGQALERWWIELPKQ